MTRNKTLLFVLSLAAFTFSSCSGPKPVTCTGSNCKTSTGSMTVTMVADTLPANPSLLTFRVTITGITFTTSTGTKQSITLPKALTVDLMRLQSDTVFLGTFANILTGQYSSVTVTFSGTANITFLNDTTATISSCAPGAVCAIVSNGASSNAVATVSFSVSQNAVTGIGIDFNFSKAVSISNGNLVVNLSNANVLSAFTLPRAGSNLAAGQLDLIEDFTGVVSIGNPAITLASASTTGRGSLTASSTPSTNFDPDPTGTHCPTGTTTLAACVSNNEFASMDVILKSDGTLAIQEIEPLLAALQDTVEGIVVTINPSNSTQFKLVVTDLVPAAQNSLIGTLHIGDTLTVNLSTNVNPFLVDAKGLPVASQFASNFMNFSGQTNTTAIHLGQTVAVHVISPFVAAVGNTPASANTDTVTLRWSRFTSTPQTVSSPAFNITNIPSFFNFALGSFFQVQTFPGTPGSAHVTNFDGVPDASGLTTSKPVAIRALFLENANNSAAPAFFAAEVRQH